MENYVDREGKDIPTFEEKKSYQEIPLGPKSLLLDKESKASATSSGEQYKCEDKKGSSWIFMSLRAVLGEVAL